MLVLMDTEIAFESLNQTFSISVVKRYGFGDFFIFWVKVTSKKI